MFYGKLLSLTLIY